MVLEKGTVLNLRLPKQLRRSIKALATQGGTTFADWIRMVLVAAVHEGRFVSTEIDSKDDPGIDSTKAEPVRLSARLKKYVDDVGKKPDVSTQTWLRVVLSRAANEGAFAPRKGDRHGSKPKRKPAP